MKTYKLKDFFKGWFIGNFEPTLLKTSNFEVAFQTHKKGYKTTDHYHKQSEEFNCLIHGKLSINGIVFEEGDIFIMEPMEVSKSEILEDCEILVVRIPSLKDDKVII